MFRTRGEPLLLSIFHVCSILMGDLKADLVLVDGRVVTVDSEDSIVEAVAVRDGRIVAVGDSSDVMSLAGECTRVVDLGGKTMLPGIIDTHTHPSGAAVRFMEIDCRSPPVESIGEILAHVQPQDLIKYGLIPEFVGRLPVVAVLDDLGEEALVRVLTEPKNALVKQYQRLFEFESVRLTFAPEALRAIARKAKQREGGARGLRSVVEELMLDIMFELPSQGSIKECVVNEDVVNKGEPPILVYERAG